MEDKDCEERKEEVAKAKKKEKEVWTARKEETDCRVLGVSFLF